MNVYFDESGDLGFSFDKPYRDGGSSRYLTIAFLLVSSDLSHLPKRIIRKIYKKKRVPTSTELKGSDFDIKDLIFFAEKTVDLLKANPDIKILAITVNKKRVADHIRKDPNKLYNYMVGLALLNRIKKYPRINFIPDIRSIKVESGNSLKDYLQTELWFKQKANTEIINQPLESYKSLNLQFAHWVTHIIWKKYEDRKTKAFNVLTERIKLIELFFRS